MIILKTTSKYLPPTRPFVWWKRRLPQSNNPVLLQVMPILEKLQISQKLSTAH